MNHYLLIWGKEQRQYSFFASSERKAIQKAADYLKEHDPKCGRNTSKLYREVTFW